MSDLNVALATAVMGDVPWEAQRRVFASMGINVSEWQERFVRDAALPETGPALSMLTRARARQEAHQ